MKEFKQWEGFSGRLWKEGIDVRDFIQKNYKPYDGDESFLAGQPKRRISFGANCRNFRRKREKKVAFWTWRQRLFPL